MSLVWNRDDPAVAEVKGSLAMTEVLRRAARQRVPGAPHEFSIFWRDNVLRLDGRVLGRVRRNLLSHGPRNRQLPRIAGALLDELWRQVRSERGRERGREYFDDELLSTEAFVEFATEWWPPLTAEQVLTWLRDPEFVSRVADGVLGADAQALLTSSWGAEWSVEDIPLIDELRYALGDIPAKTGELGVDDLDPLEGIDLQEITTAAEREYAPSRRGWAPPTHRIEDDGYAHVLVDEAQDLSPMQWRMVGRRGRAATWTVVGDAAQSSWPRPAEAAKARAEALAGPIGRPIHEFHLSTNYRNSAEIYDYAAGYAQRVGLSADLPTAVRSTGEHPVERSAGADLESAVRAAVEALEKLDEKGVLTKTSTLFRLASTAASPAVVHISVYRNVPEGVAAGAPPTMLGLRPGTVRTGSGSGVVIDKAQGLIVTNNHVIDGADDIGIRFGRGDATIAQVVGTDPKTDLAVLRVPGPLRAEARWGDSDALDIGDWVLAIGSPFELDQTVTSGIVSATGRSNLRIVGFDSYEDFIQTDAAINPGNSGGPLVNLKGEVVGINTAIMTENGGNQGIGLAISSALARKVVEGIVSTGRVVRGYLGVVIEDLNKAKAADLNVPLTEGVIVREVEPGSPADQAGLKVGDVVVELGDQSVGDVDALRHRTASLNLGSEVALAYYRDGQLAKVPVRIEPLPIRLQLGFQVMEIGPPLTEQLPDKPQKALMTTRITPGSAAARAGLLPGLFLLKVGDQSVSDRLGLDSALAARDTKQGVPVQLLGRDGQPRTITIGGPPPVPKR